MRPVAYIAGPIRNNPNAQADFANAAAKLLDMGYRPINPIDHEDVNVGDHDADYENYYKVGGVPPWVLDDIGHILSLKGVNGDIIAVLDGWEKSTGACAEVSLAQWIRVPVFKLTSDGLTPLGQGKTPTTPREHLLDLHGALCSAARDLMAQKNHDYASNADPYRNFRLFGTFGILVRLGDKFARLRSFEENGEFLVKTESVLDTVLDIINYAVLYIGMSKETKA